jgi:hypothetical protein
VFHLWELFSTSVMIEGIGEGVNVAILWYRMERERTFIIGLSYEVVFVY